MPTPLDRLANRFSRWAVPNVTPVLILGQVAAFLLTLGRPEFAAKLSLVPDRVIAGEVWRLVTFVFYPPTTNPIFALFAWYLLYLMGGALEEYWGAFRYNVYLLISYVATILAAFTLPSREGTNAYMLGSVFLAFATLFPNFELSLFFVLPVKVKYLALMTWILYFFTAALGDWEGRAMVLAAVSNYLLFFSRDIWHLVRHNKRRMDYQRRRQKLDTPPRIIHRCTVCGATQDSHPQREFRYCSKCNGNFAYCDQHLRDHVHQ
jgi:hypothetical protein